MSDVVASDGVVSLRRWQEPDADAVYAACQDAEIQHWIPAIPRPYSRENALAFVRGEVDAGQHQFAVLEGDRVIGAIGMRVNSSRTGHVGYWCTAAARGRGLTTRALRLITRFGLDELGLQRLELITDPDNGGSQRVAEKVGYRREGVLRSHIDHPDGRRRDSVMFSLLPGELDEG
jgi:RimJ/RimL family protein N-acetyltransferase